MIGDLTAGSVEKTRLATALEAVEETLRVTVESDVTVLDEASLHIIESGGKRVRPQIVILAYLAAGGEDVEDVIPLAAAVELVHTATLVHDDINDHSLTRRGQITVHARWGRTFALLTGDYLFTRVYELMAPYGSPYNEIMAAATVELVEGETLQAAAAKSGKMDRETYKKIIARKTASLFAAGARMAALLAGAEDEMVEALEIYGYNLGLSFQIVDDILDIIGDPDKLGKPVGRDVVQGTGAILLQNGRRAQVDGDGAPAEVAEAELDPFQAMMQRLRESGAVDVARAEAVEVAARARQALHHLPDSPARQRLDRFIDQILERER
ncbi:MAG: polyprenyl synthetase family protein [Candidatus Promineifilaceae bacterium]|nr:polyprenyl synthetase family protein [Candidatus Promineifilaceae bacterium]